MRIVILCDLCKKPLTVPRDVNGQFRRNSHYHASIWYADTDRVYSRTGFRKKGREERATVCTPCWTDKVRPALEVIGVKFEVEEDDGSKDMELIRAPEPWPKMDQG